MEPSAKRRSPLNRTLILTASERAALATTLLRPPLARNPAKLSNDYYFNAEAVKLKRRVIAPYRENSRPKDWHETDAGGFRLTYPSNLWTEITVPFWSMPENTR